MASIALDPFSERRVHRYRRSFRIFGAVCEIRSNDRRALALAVAACGALPAQRLAGGRPSCRLDIQVNRGGRDFGKRGPPPVRTASGSGALTGIVDADNHVVIVPAARSASIAMTDSMLAHPYHVRYELIEFAILTLLARVCGLVPLHAACVGDGRLGILMLGESGAGKSTVGFHAAIGGLRLLAEDSLFVQPATMLACALPAFVHLRRDALAMLDDASLASAVRASPVIRRRSGERKYEVDLRRLSRSRISGPLRLAAVARLTSERGSSAPRPLAPRAIVSQLRREQPYASGQNGWTHFLRGIATLPAFEIARGAHPRDSVMALRRLLREIKR